MMMDSAADDDTMARAMAWLAEALVLRHELEERDWMSAEEGESEAAGLARNGEAGAAASAAGLEKEDASMIGEFDYSDLPPLLAEALTLLDGAAAMHGRLLGQLPPEDLAALLAQADASDQAADQAPLEKATAAVGGEVHQYTNANAAAPRDDVQLLRRRRKLLSWGAGP
jgi:hypothetical protein